MFEKDYNAVIVRKMISVAIDHFKLEYPQKNIHKPVSVVRNAFEERGLIRYVTTVIKCKKRTFPWRMRNI